MVAPVSTLVKGPGTYRCDIRITLSRNGRWGDAPKGVADRSEKLSVTSTGSVDLTGMLVALRPHTYQIACSTGGISERHAFRVSLAGAALFLCTP